MAYAGAAIYYAAHIRAPVRGPTTATVTAGDTLELGTDIALTNPGPFTFSGVTVVSHIELPDGQPWLASSTGPIAIGPYATQEIPLALTVPFGTLIGPAASLLVNSTKLPYDVWANGTYAHFATWQAEVRSNYSWGAPFEGLQVVPGAPVVEPNGTVALPVTISFADRSPLDLAGVLDVALLTGAGSSCATGAMAIDAPSGGGYDATSTIYAPTSCATAISHFSASWTGNGLSASLPGGNVP